MGRSYHKGKAVKIEHEDMKKLHQRVIEITEVDDCYFAQNGLPTVGEEKLMGRSYHKGKAVKIEDEDINRRSYTRELLK